jgi:FkbM family methyltransferase
MRPNTDDAVVWKQVFTDNVYDLPDALPEGSVVLDVGGHIGGFAKMCMNRGAKVISFEPDEDNANQYLANTGQPVNVAAVVGKITPQTPNKLVRYKDELPSGFTLYLHEAKEGNWREVPLVELNKVAPPGRITLLKLDCEGAEYDILEQSKHLLQRCDSVVAECHWIEGWHQRYLDVRKILQECGLTIRKTEATPAPTIFASRPGGLWTGKQKAKILLGVPSSGMISEPSSKASWLPSIHHQVDRVPSCQSGCNFTRCWQAIMNAGMQGLCTHGAMMHVDLMVSEDGGRWLDILMAEMEATGADFISVPIAIKDPRGVTSSGIGNPENRWNPWKRFTIKEINKFPKTFSIDDTVYRGKFLLHNHALCLADMRNPAWYVPGPDGDAPAIFNFEERLRLENGFWQRYQDSEDWAFSRMLWHMGLKTVITSKVKVIHLGQIGYENYGDTGLWEVDNDTKSQWGPDEEKNHAESNGTATTAVTDSTVERREAGSAVGVRQDGVSDLGLHCGCPTDGDGAGAGTSEDDSRYNDPATADAGHTGK